MLDKINITTLCQNVDDKEKKDDKTPFEDAMTQSGFGKFNVYSVLYCGFMLLGMIMETLGFSYIIPASHCDLELTLLQKTWISVIPFIAIIVTSHTWGYLADTKGRKKILLMCMSVGSIFSILSSFSPNTLSFGLMRFIAGVFIAGPSSIGYAYLGELNPKAQRDMMLTLGNASVGLGTAVVPLIAWGILPLDFRFDLSYIHYRPWRLLVCIYALPYVICALLIFKFPESPKFLAAQGRHKEALDVLRNIFSINTGKSPDSFPVISLKSEGADAKGEERSFLYDVWCQTAPLFRSYYLKYTLLTCYLQFVVFGSTNGFYIWFPVVIDKLLTHSDDTQTLCTIFTRNELIPVYYDDVNSTTTQMAVVCNDILNTGTFTITIILSVIVTICTISAAFLIKVIGKKIILVVVFIITALCTIAVDWVKGTMLAICAFAVIQINGLCIGVINAYVVEIFPTDVRAMAVCLTLMVGRIGSMFGSNVIGYLLHTECSVTYYLFGVLVFSAALLTLCLPKPGANLERKSLESKKILSLSWRQVLKISE